MTHEATRTIVITGGTGGIGYQSALGLAKTGAHVVITGRDKARGEEARRRIIAESGNDKVTLVLGDISSIAGVDALAAAVSEVAAQIDVLVNNAGYLGSELTKSDDGLEMHFAVNVLSPRRLAHALLPALQAANAPRVLNITGGDKPARIDPDNLQAEKGFKGLMTYTHSKSAMEAMSVALAAEFEPAGVSVNLVFPGRASTVMTRSLSTKSLPGPMKLMYPLFRMMFAEDDGKSAAKAAKSTIWAATSPDLEGVTGRYFDTHTKERSLHSTAYEADVQARILATIEAAGQGTTAGE
ncbi:MAG: SDR family NAD(P)-dependent oxidoreductase [Myxococcota bacterium]